MPSDIDLKDTGVNRYMDEGGSETTDHSIWLPACMPMHQACELPKILHNQTGIDVDRPRSQRINILNGKYWGSILFSMCVCVFMSPCF